MTSEERITLTRMAKGRNVAQFFRADGSFIEIQFSEGADVFGLLAQYSVEKHLNIEGSLRQILGGQDPKELKSTSSRWQADIVVKSFADHFITGNLNAPAIRDSITLLSQAVRVPAPQMTVYQIIDIENELRSLQKTWHALRDGQAIELNMPALTSS